LDANVTIGQDRGHRIAHDPVAVVLVVEHAAGPRLWAKAGVVGEADGLRVHVAAVDELGADNDYVSCYLLRSWTAGIFGVLISAARAASPGEVDKHLVPDQWYSVRPERGLSAADLEWVSDALRYPECLDECRLVGFVLVTCRTRIRTKDNAAHVVGIVWGRQHALTYGGSGEREV